MHPASAEASAWRGAALMKEGTWIGKKKKKDAVRYVVAHAEAHPVTCASNKLAAATLLRQTDGTALGVLW